MKALVITVSDRGSRGERQDVSGPRVAEFLSARGFQVDRQTIPDEQPRIVSALREGSQEARLIVTTGGTGIAARDVTPEATRVVCEKILDGFGEQMRAAGIKRTPLAPLSRAIAGTHGNTLVINLPGSPDGAITSLEAVIELVPHALALLAGDTEHAPHPAHRDSH